MKNVILTHKELQTQIFIAVAEGMIKSFNTPKGCFLTYSIGNENFAFELWRSATKPEKGDGHALYRREINKGLPQVNDVRVNLCALYIAQEAEKFLQDVNELLPQIGFVNEIKTFIGFVRDSDKEQWKRTDLIGMVEGKPVAMEPDGTTYRYEFFKSIN
jgi:hypothetical protein